MHRNGSTARALQLALALAWIAAIGLAPRAARAQQGADAAAPSPIAFLDAMAGDWTVTQRMRPAAGADPVDLPPAKASRRIVDGAFLQETMTQAGGDAFTRTAWLVFNASNGQFEYASLDSRLPQLMAYAQPGANRRDAAGLHLQGGMFVAPKWGTRANVPFVYRIDVGPVEGGRQQVRLFLREPGSGQPEFAAFEYEYAKAGAR